MKKKITGTVEIQIKDLEDQVNNISHYPEQRHEERSDERRKRRGEQIQQCNMRITGIPEGFFFF